MHQVTTWLGFTEALLGRESPRRAIFSMQMTLERLAFQSMFEAGQVLLRRIDPLIDGVFGSGFALTGKGLENKRRVLLRFRRWERDNACVTVRIEGADAEEPVVFRKR